ncbi:uncharacterized protein C8Q71DRAFT_87665 [Rhodofomes roseus]|uniref:N-acetyltransferase domain-containing protein n=1 Tax=Rhodofomes roseus TaxID=34475 RepID=A0ABQ8KD84_9APHY|nr:uncharacterized protein C8Q71DRAFT_87665 [Rhodofomes roseus]KAH9835599.1 hypothetical protein C8Q71DRAFT_87665 [Rhodofomes roseus]
MATPAARIRPFQPSDDKDVRFIVGKAAMEPLAVANMKVYMHPITLAIWGGLSCIFIQYMQWWPHPDYGFLGYFLPLPGFACMAVPIMFLCDWFNRQPIEEAMQQVLHRPDLVSVTAWYSRSPSSGVWILEFGDKFVGLIALDASLDSTSTAPVSATQSLAKRGKKVEFPSGTSYTAVIRHFYVDEAYRPAGAQHDLLQFVLKHAFESDPAVQEVKCHDSPLRKYVSDALKKAGFELEWKMDKVGMLGWQNSLRTLNRSKWRPVT